MSDNQPTILVTNVTVENITISPGIAIDATLQTVRDLLGKGISKLPKFRN